MTRSEFLNANRPMIDAAAGTLVRELAKRGHHVNNSTSILIAVEACAAWEGIVFAGNHEVIDMKGHIHGRGHPRPGRHR